MKMKNIVTTSQIADFFIKKGAESYEQYEEKCKDKDWWVPFTECWFRQFRSVEARKYMRVQKLQCLLGYAYVWFLALKGEKLFDEKMYACKGGYFFHSQNKRFVGKHKRFRGKLANGKLEAITPVLPPNISGFLCHIWECYGDSFIYEFILGDTFSDGSFNLSDMQCSDPPWKKAEKTQEREVKDEWIKEFYSPENNEEIANYLPENVVLTISNDGLHEIVRLAIGDPEGR